VKKQLFAQNLSRSERREDIDPVAVCNEWDRANSHTIIFEVSALATALVIAIDLSFEVSTCLPYGSKGVVEVFFFLLLLVVVFNAQNRSSTKTSHKSSG